MRGSMFVANEWGRHPLRPFNRVRMGQSVVCDGDVCRVERPGQEPAPVPTPPVPPPVVVAPPAEEFPIVPVAIGAGALILALTIL